MKSHAHPVRSIVLAATLALLLTVTSGCSSFNRDWESAAALDTAGHHVLGRWQGRWHSDDNQHEGDLRAIITRPTDAPAGTYHARYHATWAIFTGEFESQLVGQSTEGVYTFTTDQDLGMFGQFSAQGTADGQLFNATFEAAKGDHGTFKMTRPTGE